MEKLAKGGRTGRPITTPGGANLLSELRRLKGWSQRALAEELGLSHQSISRIENGKGELSGSALKLAQLLLAQIQQQVEGLKMFESHSIIGRLGNFRNAESNGKKVVNVSLAVQRGRDQTTWWELAFWGEQSENFLKLNIDKGAIIAANIYNVYPDAYLDKEQKPQATIKATVSNFRVLPSAQKDTNE